MKPRPLIRKTIKWGGAVLTVLLVVVWVGSGWCILEWRTPHGAGVYLFHGVAWAGCNGSREEPSPRIVLPKSVTFALGWSRFDYKTTGAYWCIVFPFWIAPLIPLLPAVAARRLDTLARRRARQNLCPTCRYDRTGLASKDAVCPECGAAAPSRP